MCTILKPTIKHLQDIHQLIQDYANQGIMLSRSKLYVVEHLRDFLIAVDDDGTVIGCCAFVLSLPDLAEVKSLAVHKDHHRRGIGEKLLTAGLQELKDMGIQKAFCLTYVPDFFKKAGFSEIDKNDLPHKIWTECVNCPSFPDCDEIALIKKL